MDMKRSPCSSAEPACRPASRPSRSTSLCVALRCCSAFNDPLSGETLRSALLFYVGHFVSEEHLFSRTLMPDFQATPINTYEYQIYSKCSAVIRIGLLNSVPIFNGKVENYARIYLVQASCVNGPFAMIT